VDKDSFEDIEEIIDLALKDSWRYRDLGWSAIGPICKRLGPDDSLEEQRAVISLMYANTHSAQGKNLAPSNLPVDHVCRCLQMHSNAYEDVGQEIIRTSLLSDGVLLLGHMNDPIAIDTLLIFINTSENRVGEFSLKAIEELVESSSSFCRGEDRRSRPRRKTELLEGQAVRIEREMMAFLEVSDNPVDRLTALKILFFLEKPHIVEYMEGVMESQNYRERRIALNTFKHHWNPRLMPIVLSQIGLRDDSDFGQLNPNWYLRDLVEIIGTRGGNEQVQLLLGLLSEHSKMREKGDMKVRNSVRRALVEMRDHSKKDVEQALKQDQVTPGFRNSLKKTLKLMEEAEEEINTPEQMRFDLFSWRTEKFNEEGLEYPFQILTDRQVIEIARRAPQSYEGIMGIDGLGPFKADKYGRELLSIIRRHMNPDNPDAAIVEPWILPIDVRRWLSSEMESVELGGWSIFTDEEKLDHLKRIGASTKMRIKKEAKNHHIFSSNDQEILDKIIDYILKSLTYDGMLAVAGQKRGMRYARFSQCLECGKTEVEFGDGHECKCRICREHFTGSQCNNVICLLNPSKIII
jgi:hypothetical protein